MSNFGGFSGTNGGGRDERAAARARRRGSGGDEGVAPGARERFGGDVDQAPPRPPANTRGRPSAPPQHDDGGDSRRPGRRDDDSTNNAADDRDRHGRPPAAAVDGEPWTAGREEENEGAAFRAGDDELERRASLEQRAPARNTAGYGNDAGWSRDVVDDDGPRRRGYDDGGGRGDQPRRRRGERSREKAPDDDRDAWDGPGEWESSHSWRGEDDGGRRRERDDDDGRWRGGDGHCDTAGEPRLVRRKGGRTGERVGGARNTRERSEHYGDTGRYCDRHGGAWNESERRERTLDYGGSARNDREREGVRGGARERARTSRGESDQHHDEGGARERGGNARATRGPVRERALVLFREEEPDAVGGHGQTTDEGAGHGSDGDEGYAGWNRNRGLPTHQEEQRGGGSKPTAATATDAGLLA